jgi:hypothetical protein
MRELPSLALEFAEDLGMDLGKGTLVVFHHITERSDDSGELGFQCGCHALEETGILA